MIYICTKLSQESLAQGLNSPLPPCKKTFLKQSFSSPSFNLLPTYKIRLGTFWDFLFRSSECKGKIQIGTRASFIFASFFVFLLVGQLSNFLFVDQSLSFDDAEIAWCTQENHDFKNETIPTRLANFEENLLHDMSSCELYTTVQLKLW